MTPLIDDQLVPFLLDHVPATATFLGRSELLDGVPGRHGFSRSEDNQQLDLQRIVGRVRRDRGSLLCFVRNIERHLDSDETAELRAIVARLSPRVMRSSLRVVALHRFDLESAVEEALPRIEAHRGLCGFIVCSTCDPLVESLVERIKEAMLPLGDACARKLNSLDGIRPPDFAVRRIRKMRDTLRVQSIVCSAVVPDRAAANALWSVISAELAECPRRFVLVVMVHEAAAAPPGLYALPVPVFRRRHVIEWWEELALIKGWAGTSIADLVAAHAPGDTLSEPLDMDTVYDDLADAIELLKHHDDEELFHAAWMERQ